MNIYGWKYTYVGKCGCYESNGNIEIKEILFSVPIELFWINRIK